MAGRIRSIKPDWLEDELMATASSDARVLSIALILEADDYGNGRCPMALGSRVFPPRGESQSELARPYRVFREALAKLCEIRFCSTYQVDGQTYFTIRNWSKHQKVDHPGKPQVPPPLTEIRDSLSTVSRDPSESLESTSEASARAILSIPFPSDPSPPEDLPDRLDQGGDPWGLGPDGGPIPVDVDPIDQVFRHWSAIVWPKVHRDGSKPKASEKRLSKIRARLADGYTVDQLKCVIDRVAESPYHLGENDSQRPYIEFETIFRSSEKVDGWLAKACPTAKSQRQQPMSLDEAMR